MDKQREYGIQPLDKILNELDLTNHDLVGSSTKQITHKMAHKGRKGRRLSRNVQTKILNALNACQNIKMFTLQDIFTYDGK